MASSSSGSSHSRVSNNLSGAAVSSISSTSSSLQATLLGETLAGHLTPLAFHCQDNNNKNNNYNNVVNVNVAKDISDEVPQWKKDLIERRRQNKLLFSPNSSNSANNFISKELTSPSSGVYSSQINYFENQISSNNKQKTNKMRLESDGTLLLSLKREDDGVVISNGRSTASRRPPQLDIALPSSIKSRSDSPNQEQQGAESDSSEELQYGPGIVHKLRSKYLNLTLREMNKNKASVQGFRRAASYEDLLDCKDEEPEKLKRYVKKNTSSTAAKVERYRNVIRGNDSIKRARSVETLMRSPDEFRANGFLNCHNLQNNIFKQENDHIILVDRTSVKIENRLVSKEKPKPVNKPRRIKQVLADTERPPPDLVKTTLRIFEGSSVKKLKPKGEVAAKVATFKTINDTFKAQNQKKITPKPPLQPKPLINGNSRNLGSPKKVVVTRSKTSTAELLDNKVKFQHNDGVITDPIVKSVSSVVSKFQQIEKSQSSPSQSPEPSHNKFLKFSPVPSPEPFVVRSKALSPKSTPSTSPSTLISPPKIQSPLSPKILENKQVNTFVQKLQSNCNIEPIKCSTAVEYSNFHVILDSGKDFVVESTNEVDEENRDSEEDKDNDCCIADGSPSPTDTFNELTEDIDGPKIISKFALENISKAGVTVQYSFNESTSIKTYLPKQLPLSPSDQVLDVITSTECPLEPPTTLDIKHKACPLDSNQSTPNFCEEILDDFDEPELSAGTPDGDNEEDTTEETASPVDNKPIGAISSLGLMKSTMTTSFSQGNESKTIKCQKSETIVSPPQKQIGIIRPLVSTKTQLPQQNLSDREIEKNLINRVKSIEQPTKVLVSLKSADEIQPVKQNNGNNGGGLWDTKPWSQNNTMVFNFSNRKDVPDYIENDGLIIRKKKDKSRNGDATVIVSTLNSLTDDSELEFSCDPPSPCDVAFLNDNVLINGRSNLSRTPRNHKHRIQFDDTATRTFEYPSESSMLEPEGVSSPDGCTSGSVEHQQHQQHQTPATRSSPTSPTSTLPSLLGGGALASYTPSKVDLASEGYVLGVTRATFSTLPSPQLTSPQQPPSITEVDYVKPSQDANTWGQETAADMLY